MILPDDRPNTLAMAYLDDRGYRLSDKEDSSYSIRHWREEFYAWIRPRPGTQPCVYRRCVSEELHSDVTRFLNGLKCRDKKGKPEPLHVTQYTVRETLGQMRSICQVISESTPCWIGPTYGRSAVKDVVAFENGLIDAEKYAADETILPHPPTPDWFSESVLPCGFDRSAKCPMWMKFLDTALRGDTDLILLLQQWFGYCMTGDTGLQKMLWMYGRAGAGKSTVAKVLQLVVGAKNTVNFTLHDLTKNFTLSAFLGKTLAISGDAVLGRDSDSSKVLEELKSISGEDDRGVDRKNREMLTNVRLKTRFVILLNSLPILPDSAMALKRRIIFVPFMHAVDASDRDDRLFDKLASEVAGIALWSMQGLSSLRNRGTFVEPKASTELMDRFGRLGSPVHSFKEECCVVHDCKSEMAPSVEKPRMYDAYKRWCMQSGHKPMHRDRFGEALLESCEGRVMSSRPRSDGSRVRHYLGIELDQGFVDDWALSNGKDGELPYM